MYFHINFFLAQYSIRTLSVKELSLNLKNEYRIVKLWILSYGYSSVQSDMQLSSACFVLTSTLTIYCSLDLNLQGNDNS